MIRWRLLPCLLVLFMALCGHWLAPHSPYELHLDHALEGPSRMFLFGTDPLGRCLLSRLLQGAATSVRIALFVTTMGVSVGTFLGLLGGYFGGLTDRLVTLLTNVFLTIPGLVLGLALAGWLGPGTANLILALSCTVWMKYARVVRQVTRVTLTQGYVTAAQLAGASAWRILPREILPELLSPVAVLASLSLGQVMLNASALSFLGLGVSPPEPEWGAMLNSARPYLNAAPRLLLLPGLAISLAVASFHLLAAELREKIGGYYTSELH